jgi:IMP dehydrogenase
MTTTVRQLLEEKGYVIQSIEPDALVYDAIKRMNEESVGALLVIENERLKGIISERDYTRKIVLLNKSSRETPVREIMTEKVFYMTPEHNIEDCMVLMSKQLDVMKHIISDKEVLIEQLENYISGTGYS